MLVCIAILIGSMEWRIWCVSPFWRSSLSKMGCLLSVPSSSVRRSRGLPEMSSPTYGIGIVRTITRFAVSLEPSAFVPETGYLANHLEG
jgi:hypothetical protein